MYLEKINSPDDVKKLNVHELEVLAAEMRIIINDNNHIRALFS